MIFTMPGQSFK